MEAVSTASRLLARALTACAVLIGLAFMHTLGGSIGTGCAGDSSAMSGAVAPPPVTSGHHKEMAHTVATTVASSAGVAGVPGDGHGSVCVATPPRGKVSGPSPPATTGLAEPAVLEQPSPVITRLTGAAPRAGPALLISLGVSRT